MGLEHPCAHETDAPDPNADLSLDYALEIASFEAIPDDDGQLLEEEDERPDEPAPLPTNLDLSDLFAYCFRAQASEPPSSRTAAGSTTPMLNDLNDRTPPHLRSSAPKIGPKIGRKMAGGGRLFRRWQGFEPEGGVSSIFRLRRRTLRSVF